MDRLGPVGAVAMTITTPDAPPIRTPDQRLRVFVSSSLGELGEKRQAVADAITTLRLASHP
jgi:hypothetical protein